MERKRKGDIFRNHPLKTQHRCSSWPAVLIQKRKNHGEQYGHGGGTAAASSGGGGTINTANIFIRASSPDDKTTPYHVKPKQPLPNSFSLLFPLRYPDSISRSSRQTGAANKDGSYPMQVGDENEEEAGENSKTSIDKVEERMRECFIKNKRAKRRLSPSSAVVAEETRICEDRFVGGVKGFDPLGDKLRALDLVYQFYG